MRKQPISLLGSGVKGLSQEPQASRAQKIKTYIGFMMEGTKFIFKIKQNFIHIPFKIQIAICQLTCDMAAVYYIFNEQSIWSWKERKLLPVVSHTHTPPHGGRYCSQNFRWSKQGQGNVFIFNKGRCRIAQSQVLCRGISLSLFC